VGVTRHCIVTHPHWVIFQVLIFEQCWGSTASHCMHGLLSRSEVTLCDATCHVGLSYFLLDAHLRGARQEREGGLTPPMDHILDGFFRLTLSHHRFLSHLLSLGFAFSL